MCGRKKQGADSLVYIPSFTVDENAQSSVCRCQLSAAILTDLDVLTRLENKVEQKPQQRRVLNNAGAAKAVAEAKAGPEAKAVARAAATAAAKGDPAKAVEAERTNLDNSIVAVPVVIV